MATIRIEGAEVTLLSRAGETLNETIRRAGMALRDACRRGGCGVFRIEIRQGSVTLNRPVSEQALPAEEREAGITLACRAVPDGDVVIGVPPGGHVRMIMPMLTRLASSGLPEPRLAGKEGDHRVSSVPAAAEPG